MTMSSQQNGSAKRFLPYHNNLILRNNKNQTVKDQYEIFRRPEKLFVVM